MQNQTRLYDERTVNILADGTKYFDEQIVITGYDWTNYRWVGEWAALDGCVYDVRPVGTSKSKVWTIV